MSRQTPSRISNRQHPWSSGRTRNRTLRPSLESSSWDRDHSGWDACSSNASSTDSSIFKGAEILRSQLQKEQQQRTEEDILLGAASVKAQLFALEKKSRVASPQKSQQQRSRVVTPQKQHSHRSQPASPADDEWSDPWERRSVATSSTSTPHSDSSGFSRLEESQLFPDHTYETFDSKSIDLSGSPQRAQNVVSPDDNQKLRGGTAETKRPVYGGEALVSDDEEDEKWAAGEEHEESAEEQDMDLHDGQQSIEEMRARVEMSLQRMLNSDPLVGLRQQVHALRSPVKESEMALAPGEHPYSTLRRKLAAKEHFDSDSDCDSEECAASDKNARKIRDEHGPITKKDLEDMGFPVMQKGGPEQTDTSASSTLFSSVTRTLFGSAKGFLSKPSPPPTKDQLSTDDSSNDDLQYSPPTPLPPPTKDQLSTDDSSNDDLQYSPRTPLTDPDMPPPPPDDDTPVTTMGRGNSLRLKIYTYNVRRTDEYTDSETNYSNDTFSNSTPELQPNDDLQYSLSLASSASRDGSGDLVRDEGRIVESSSRRLSYGTASPEYDFRAQNELNLSMASSSYLPGKYSGLSTDSFPCDANVNDDYESIQQQSHSKPQRLKSHYDSPTLSVKGVSPLSISYSRIVRDPAYRHAQKAGLLWQTLVSQHVRFPGHWWDGDRSPQMGMMEDFSGNGKSYCSWQYISRNRVYSDPLLKARCRNRAAPGRVLLHVVVRDLMTYLPVQDIAIGVFHPNARGIRRKETPDPRDEDCREVWLAVRKRAEDGSVSVVDRLLTKGRSIEDVAQNSPLGGSPKITNQNMRAVFGERPPVQTVIMLESELYERMTIAAEANRESARSPALTLIREFLSDP